MAADHFTSDFEPGSVEQWRARALRALNGAGLERLRSSTYDGLAIESVVGEADPVWLPERASKGWRAVARIDHPDSAQALAQARVDLAGGADAIDIVGAHSPSAFGYGLALDQLEPRTFCAKLADRPVGVSLDCGVASAARAARLVSAWAEAARECGIAFDAAIAPAPDAETQNWARAAESFAALRERGWRGRLFAADARRVHSAGGSEAQELAVALASAIAWMRLSAFGPLDQEAVARALTFRLAADADQFLVVGKLRALRALWARASAACGIAGEPAFVHVETSWRMMARRAPINNALRATIAATAAALGGANAIAILPFTQPLGLPDADARRLGRNTHLILSRECRLDETGDPAAGSWPIERLTRDLCEAAWSIFQDIEKRGGLAGALKEGWLQGEVRRVRRLRECDVARRVRRIVGVSEFPDLDEDPSAGCCRAPASPAIQPDADGFAPRRDSQPYERFRDLSDAVLAQTGARPKVFLTTLGASEDCAVAAALAVNVFESGGIVTLAATPGEEMDAAEARFAACGAPLACLCLSPDAPAELAALLGERFARSGARRLYCAGGSGAPASAPMRRIDEQGDALALLADAYAALGLGA